MEGEDSCADTGDFTIDFDDRGMDNNQNDGTDWGEDDRSKKMWLKHWRSQCTVANLGSRTVSGVL